MTLVKEWISREAPEEIKGLIPGKTYILREISAPDGYTVAEDTQFVSQHKKYLQKKFSGGIVCQCWQNYLDFSPASFQGAMG